jgi:hypothetical protein
MPTEQTNPLTVTLRAQDGYPRCPRCGGEDLLSRRWWLYSGYLAAERDNALAPYQSDEDPVEDRWEAVWCTACGWEVQDKERGIWIEIVADEEG